METPALTREQELSLIRNHINGGLRWDSGPEYLVAALNAANQPNPTPQPTQRRTIYSKQLLALISPESRVKVLEYPSLVLVKEAINTQNLDSMLEWVNALMTVERITEDEAALCYQWIVTPIPCPDWDEFLPWSIIHLGRLVDVVDITTAEKLPRLQYMRQLQEDYGKATSAAYALVDPNFILPETLPTRADLVAAFSAALGTDPA